MSDAADARAIERLHDTWIALERQGRFTSLVPFLTEEVVVQPEGSAPLVGRDAVAERFFARDGDPLDVQARILHVAIHGSNAVKLASFRQITPGAETLGGYHTWFLEKDGEWRIAYLGWTFTPKDDPCIGTSHPRSAPPEPH